MTERTIQALAVYCGSSSGRSAAYVCAGRSLGSVLAKTGVTLVYGGGQKGVMGAVSSATLQAGGKVVGIVPQQMLAAGGEGDRTEKSKDVFLDANNEQLENIVVASMHERKVEMAKRVQGFIGLPGGFGTFEEVMEVTTWTQLGIHSKPVVLLNVLGFYNPLRNLIQSSIEEGFIKLESAHIIIFVDGPAEHAEHETYDWGTAALKAVEGWEASKISPLYDWNGRMKGIGSADDARLQST